MWIVVHEATQWLWPSGISEAPFCRSAQLEMILWIEVVSWVKFQFENIGAVVIMSSWPSIDVLTVQIYGTVWYRTVWYRSPNWISVSRWDPDRRLIYRRQTNLVPNGMVPDAIDIETVRSCWLVADSEGMIGRYHNDGTDQTMVRLTVSSTFRGQYRTASPQVCARKVLTLRPAREKISGKSWRPARKYHKRASGPPDLGSFTGICHFPAKKWVLYRKFCRTSQDLPRKSRLAPG